MNTANLQLEGLLLAISCLTETLRRKGLLTAEEIRSALDEAEAGAKNGVGEREPLSEANLDAIRFPIRFLRAATSQAAGGEPMSFTALAAMIGETKPGHHRLV